MPKREKFNFRWKLIENYFNALLVIFFTVFIIYGLVYRDTLYLALVLIGVVVGPFVATFIDKKSNEERQ